MRKKLHILYAQFGNIFDFKEKSEVLFFTFNKKMLCENSTFNKQIDFKFRLLEYTLNLKHFSTDTLLLSNF